MSTFTRVTNIFGYSSLPPIVLEHYLTVIAPVKNQDSFRKCAVLNGNKIEKKSSEIIPERVYPLLFRLYGLYEWVKSEEISIRLVIECTLYFIEKFWRIENTNQFCLFVIITSLYLCSFK
jgi:hypothetical protein